METEPVIDDARQLPRGRHGLTHGAVVDHQRQRLIRAMPATLSRKGYAELTVEDISAAAGVSRKTFYENFRDKEDCFLVAYRQHAQELLRFVAGAAAAGEDWEQRALLALRTLLRALADEPDVANMAVIEVAAAGPEALSERDGAVTLVKSLIGDEALTASADPAPRLMLETIAGGALQLIYARVLAGRAGQLEELLPTIMYLALVAAHGPVAAARQVGLLGPGNE